MKKKFGSLFILACVLIVLSLLATVFVACDPADKGGDDPTDNQNPPATSDVTVTFDMFGEGEDSLTTGKTGEKFTFPTVADTDGYYFGGWFARADLGGEMLSGEGVFPAQNATYYAKWFKKYTFAVSLEQEDGSFARDESLDIGGTCVKDSVNVVTLDASELAIPENYEANRQSFEADMTAETKDVIVEIKLEFAALAVTYVSGLDGVENVTRNGKYGMTVEAELFGEQVGRYFLGWAESEEGQSAFFGGEKLLKKGEFSLYAVWTTAYGDIFGGYDVVSVAKGRSGRAFLDKAGYDAVEGTYDQASGTFAFSDGTKSELKGKMLENSFFYFKDTYERKFFAEDATDGECVEMKANGSATYTDKDGKKHEGSYTVDEQSGDFKFEGDVAISFRLYEPPFGIGDMYIRVKDDMQGVYAQKTEDGFSFNLLYLDGYGYAIEMWDPAHPYYNPYEDIEEYIFEGEYTLSGLSKGMPVIEFEIVRVPAYGSIVGYTVRVDESINGEMKGVLVGGASHDVSVRGAYTLADSYAGKYNSTADEEEEIELELDGYELGSYKGENGTYQTKRIQWYEFEGEYDEDDNPIYEVHSHSYIIFTGESGKETLLALEKADGREVDRCFEISAEMNVFDFENSTQLLYDSDSELMLELWHQKALVWERHQGSGVTYYTALDEGETSKLADGWTHFKGATEFDFKVTSVTEYTVRWRGASNKYVFIEDTLYIDESGIGRYVAGGAENAVEYTLDEGLADIYHFKNIGGRDYDFCVDSNGNVEDITFAKYSEEGRSSGNLYARLLTLEGGRAMIGFRLSDGRTYAYLIEGEISEAQGAFTFAATAVEEGYEEAFDDYLNFTYKIVDAQFIRYDGYELTAQGDGCVFTSDGFGGATLTMDGKTLTGTYSFLEGLTVFEYDGGDKYLAIEGEGATRSLQILSEEAGYYFEIVAGGVSSTSSYFFLDGRGNVTLSKYDPDRMIFIPLQGTYKTEGKKDEDGYALYTLEFNDADASVTYVAHLGSEKTNDGRQINTFWMEDPISSGTYAVRVRGEDMGILTVRKGTAIWIAGPDDMVVGEMFLCNVDDKDIYTQLTDGSRRLLQDANGESVFFSFEIEGSYFEMIFDITDETVDAGDGKKYSVIDARMYDYGMFGRLDGELTGERIYLDGHGNMTVYDEEGNIVDEGKVSRTEDDGNVMTFTGKTTFEFVISLRQGTTAYELSTFEYVVYDKDSDATFVGKDWTAFMMDGFGGAYLVDKYGMMTQGTYAYILDNIVRFDYDIVESAFIALANGEFSMITDDFISVGDVLYSYMGTDSEITIPDGVRTIAKQAFFGSNVTKVNFSKVERVEEGAFYGVPLEEISSDQIKFVGQSAFADIGDGLKTVNLPAVETIEAQAFFGNNAIRRLTLGAIKSVGEQAFTIGTTSVNLLVDLKLCDDPASVKFADDAFAAVDEDGYLLEVPAENLRVLVKSVAVINALAASQNASKFVRDYAVISFGEEVTYLEASQTVFGPTFYSLKDGGVYILDGKLSKIVDIDSGAVESVGLYEYTTAKDGESKQLEIYLKNGDGSYNVTPIEEKDGFIKLGDELLMSISGDMSVSHTFEDGDGKSAEVALTVRYDLFKGVVIEAKVTYDSQSASSAYAEGERIVFVIQDTEYSLRVTDETSCTVRATASVITLMTPGETFRLSVVVNAQGELESCVKFEQMSKGDFEEREVASFVKTSDGKLTLSVAPLKSSVAMLNDTYIAAYDEQNDRITLSCVSARENIWSEDDECSYGIELAWDVETFIATDCLRFSVDDAEYEVTAFSAEKVGSALIARVTVKMGASEITFEVNYVAEFGFGVRSIRQI